MKNEEAKQAFISRLNGAIRTKCTELTKEKSAITYNEGKGVVQFIDVIFISFLGFVPKQIQATEKLALTFIAPSLKEKKKMIKNVVSTMSGISGLAAIISGIGLALGWGAGTVAAVVAWFTGASMLGPIGWISAGASLTVVAGYFYFSSSDAKDAEKFETVLIGGLEEAIDGIWGEYGEQITEKMDQIQPFGKEEINVN